MPDCCLLNRIILCLSIKLSLIKLNCKIVNTDLLRKLIEKLKDFYEIQTLWHTLIKVIGVFYDVKSKCHFKPKFVGTRAKGRISKLR